MVIYLSDITVSAKELFQIRLTFISDSSDCENMIALFVFSFILLIPFLPHKRDLRLKACISTIFILFSSYHFSSKNSWAHFQRILQRTLLIYNSLHMNQVLQACGFANIFFFFNRELNLFCFFKLRCRNDKAYFQLLLLLSGNISLNVGPINGSQQYNNDQAVF